MKKFYSLSGLFVLLILWSGVSARSLKSEPVGKTFSGINEVPVTNLQATLTNEFSGEIILTWECTPSAGFLYYTVKRDGIQLAIIPSVLTYSDILPACGNYTYCVEAVYNTGPSVPDCTVAEWPNPTMVWAPALLTATVFPTQQAWVPLYIGNTGDGTLAFEFPDWTDHPGDSPLAYCPASATDVDEFISLVQLGTINNSSGWNGYSDYTSITTDVVKELSYPVTVIVGPPSYSGDITGVWIDFDHSNTFDAAEFFALTGTSPATGAISIPATALTGPTTMRVRTQYSGTLSPCGNTQYGEVEDYTINIKQPTFITSVTPASGMVASNTSPGSVVNVAFSAIGPFAQAGVYTNQLVLNSNDPGHASVNITAIMTVMTPGYIQGIVTDCVTGEPINGVLVSAGSYSSMTNELGSYSLLLSSGFYTVNFTKIGFQPVMATASVTAQIVTTVNVQMCEIPYPPACAHASVNFEDTECTVSWCPPDKQYELMYDDGIAENYAAWEFAGNRNAVKFTPQGYPAKIMGAKIYIGNGPYGNAVGSSIGILVCKADAAGLPGQVIDSVAAVVYNTGWLNIVGLSATVTSGDFFIVMIQGQPAPNCPYLGVDETPTTVNKSYSRDVVNGGAWELSAYQDFMIRAIVSSPDNGSNNFYSLTRIWLGAANPVPPANGAPTLLSNTLTGTTYSEGGSAWANLAQGWYAYGIKAGYPNGQSSEYIYTNIVPHNIFADLTINVQLECGLVPAEGAIVTLTGNNYPYDILTDTVSASGTLTFSQIIQGEFSISITYPEYENYTQQVSLSGNEVVNVVLLQVRNKPLNLHVSENELVATWQAPRGILMSEDFEGSTFPSSGWSVSSWGMGWFSATNGSSDSLVIPSHTTYTVANDQLGGATNNGCCDYLYTPMLDLRGAPDYTLTFSSFFNGLNGQLGYVEISTDYGATWTPLYACQSTYGFWETKTIDLSAYSGPSGSAGVMFAFHADDAGNQASGWAIDDVSITHGGLDVSGYKVYLDGTEMGQTTGLTWPFDPATFNCQDYQAAVEAIYCTGTSEPATDDFTNGFAYPPANLAADTSITATSGAVILSWQVPLNCLSNVVWYNIYRNDVCIAQVSVADTIYWDMNLMPKTYCYDMTSVYDLTFYGMPGMYGESIKAGPACVDIIFGGDLPFSDDFSGGVFDTTMWNPGQNWLVDEDSDNPVPAAKFKWDPLMTNYSSALQSNSINISGIDTTTPYKIYFDYEIKLEDFSASGSEKLTVELWNGSGWNVAKEYSNTGSFDWTMEHLDITVLAGVQAFMVRFRANGNASDAIRYWAVDNVHIYSSGAYLLPPMNLVVNPSGSIGNENHLVWEPPLTGNTIMSYILDDNTVEFSTFYNATGECWLGNEFPVTESGVLQSVSLFMETNNGSAIYSIAIFDENHDSVYSSAPFIPVFGEWTDVELPFVAFNGPFYVMLHMVVTNNSDYLALDQDGPNTAASLAWYTDDLLAWAQLSDLGFEPSVAFIRATGITSDKKTSVTFNPRFAVKGTLSASQLALQPLSINTGNEFACSTPLSDNNETLLGYNIYRRGYAVFPPGQNTSTSGYWTLINPTLVVQNEYFDQYLSNLEYNCYDYRVSAVYEAGAAASNLEWGCIFTNINPVMTGEVNLYPNPATTFIRIELNGDISDMKVFNALGFLVIEKNIAGETTLVLNTSGYAAGMYTVMFTTRKGECFSRKFVKL